MPARLTATRPDLDALRTPREAPMPTDDRTRAILELDLDAWWHRLTPGQRMTLHLEYGA